MPKIGTTISRLFSLPEYERAQFEFFHSAVQGLMKAKDPIYAQIREGDSSETIPTTQNTMPSGEMVQTQPVIIESRVTFRWDDIRCCNLNALAEQVDTIAEQRIQAVMRHFFDTFGRTCEAAGTATDLAGAPLTFESQLQSFSKIDLQFNRDGTPIMPQLVVHPDTAKKLANLPPWTEEQQKRWDEMIEEKRKEFFAKRRHRKLC
ncbi:MAG: hypothetical protein WA634_12385 [Silvibacterium sp.]